MDTKYSVYSLTNDGNNLKVRHIDRSEMWYRPKAGAGYNEDYNIVFWDWVNHYTPSQRRKVYEDTYLMGQSGITSIYPGTIYNYTLDEPVQLDCFNTIQGTVAKCQGLCVGYPEVEKKGNTMQFIDDSVDQDTRARSYVEGRLNTIKYLKETDLTKAFGLVDDKPPSTPKDLIDRITSGKYIVSPDKMEVEDYEPLRRFRWRDPSVKEDRAGYKTAEANVRKDAQTVKDAIFIKTPAEALDALKEFEGKTFH